MKIKIFLSLIVAIAIYSVSGRFFGLTKILSFLFAFGGFILTNRIITLGINFFSKGKQGQSLAKKDKSEIVDKVAEKIREIRKNTMKIYDNDVAQEVVAICRTGIEICDYLNDHPEDLSRARQFINYYIDAFEKIVSQYVELSLRKEGNSELQSSLKRVENILGSINETYKKQLKYLLEDDILDLNTEISVLEKTMKLEG